MRRFFYRLSLDRNPGWIFILPSLVLIGLLGLPLLALVWRAIASEEKSEASKIEGKLDDMVRKSLEKYPPKQK